MRPFTADDRKAFGMPLPTDRGPNPLPLTHPRGWFIWPIRPVQGPTTWSARPDGALTAVITNAASEADVLAKIRAYEGDVDRHLAEAEARLTACDMSNIGRDEHEVVKALCGALRAMQARLQEKS